MAAEESPAKHAAGGAGGQDGTPRSAKKKKATRSSRGDKGGGGDSGDGAAGSGPRATSRAASPTASGGGAARKGRGKGKGHKAAHKEGNGKKDAKGGAGAVPRIPTIGGQGLKLPDPTLYDYELVEPEEEDAKLTPEQRAAREKEVKRHTKWISAVALASRVGKPLAGEDFKRVQRRNAEALVPKTAMDIASESLTWDRRDLQGRYKRNRIRSKFPIPGAQMFEDEERLEKGLSTDKLSRAVEAERQRAAPLHRARQHGMSQFEKLNYEHGFGSLIDRLEDIVTEREATQLAYAKYRSTDAGRDELLFKLIAKGDWASVARKFTEHTIADPNAAEPINQMTGLMKAASAGQPKIVQMFLEHGADPNQENRTGNVALHYAWDSWLRVPHDSLFKVVKLIHTLQIVEQLCKHNANPDIPLSDSGNTALHYAAAHGHSAIALVLLRHHASVSILDKEGRSALVMAKNNGHTEVARLIESWPVIAANMATADFRMQWGRWLAADQTLGGVDVKALIDDLRIREHAMSLQPVKEITVVAEEETEEEIAEQLLGGHSNLPLALLSRSYSKRALISKSNRQRTLMSGPLSKEAVGQRIVAARGLQSGGLSQGSQLQEGVEGLPVAGIEELEKHEELLESGMQGLIGAGFDGSTVGGKRRAAAVDKRQRSGSSGSARSSRPTSRGASRPSSRSSAGSRPQSRLMSQFKRSQLGSGGGARPRSRTLSSGGEVVAGALSTDVEKKGVQIGQTFVEMKDSHAGHNLQSRGVEVGTGLTENWFFNSERYYARFRHKKAMAIDWNRMMEEETGFSLGLGRYGVATVGNLGKALLGEAAFASSAPSAEPHDKGTAGSAADDDSAKESKGEEDSAAAPPPPPGASATNNRVEKFGVRGDLLNTSMLRRRLMAARHLADDAHVDNLHKSYKTGEKYVRRPALSAPFLRGHRLRVVKNTADKTALDIDDGDEPLQEGVQEDLEMKGIKKNLPDWVMSEDALLASTWRPAATVDNSNKLRHMLEAEHGEAAAAPAAMMSKAELRASTARAGAPLSAKAAASKSTPSEDLTRFAPKEVLPPKISGTKLDPLTRFRMEQRMRARQDLANRHSSAYDVSKLRKESKEPLGRYVVPLEEPWTFATWRYGDR